MGHLVRRHHRGDQVIKCEHCSQSVKKSLKKSHLKNCKASFPNLLKEAADKPGLLESDDSEEVLCEGCNLNISRLDEALEHLKDLCKNFESFNFEDRKVFRANRFRCPICLERNFNKKSEARFHILVHVNEIHTDVKTCGICARSNIFSDV